MFCITENNKILGIIDLEKNKIGGLFVKYNYINKGIGKKIINIY